MGIQGIGASEFAYQNAAQYATDRIQGRNASGIKSPNKVADSILVHGDVRRMRPALKTRMNLEIAVTNEMVEFAKEIRPQHVCFVPEKRQELTTEGGLDVVTNFEKVKAATQALLQVGCDVSLFIDADLAQIDAAIACGAPTIEIHTGAYADAHNEAEQQAELERIIKGTEYAAGKGLVVNAGHGLNIDNVTPIAAIPQIHELNIGHSIIADSLFIGLAQAVQQMKAAIKAAR